jgi:hypothetical protein
LFFLPVGNSGKLVGYLLAVRESKMNWLKAILSLWILFILSLMTCAVARADMIDDIKDVVVCLNKTAYQIHDSVNGLKYKPLDNVTFSLRPEPLKSIGKGKFIYNLKMEVTF